MKKLRICFLTLLLIITSVSLTKADENLAPIEDLPTVENETNSVIENNKLQEDVQLCEVSESISEQTSNNEASEIKLFDALYDGDQAIYSPENNNWYTGEPLNDNDIVITKKIIEGTGSYSQYYYSDDTLAMTFCSNYEFIKDGTFVVVNNENLTYSKLVYNDGIFEEVPIDILDLQVMFPDAEFIKLSNLDIDGKMWVSKIPFKKKVIFFINDTDRYFYKLTAKMKKLQPTDLRSYVVIPHYGFYTFTHFGKHKGKIRIYTR